jgi:hypothetical protein
MACFRKSGRKFREGAAKIPAENREEDRRNDRLVYILVFLYGIIVYKLVKLTFCQAIRVNHTTSTLHHEPEKVNLLKRELCKIVTSR